MSITQFLPFFGGRLTEKKARAGNANGSGVLFVLRNREMKRVEDSDVSREERKPLPLPSSGGYPELAKETEPKRKPDVTGSFCDYETGFKYPFLVHG